MRVDFSSRNPYSDGAEWKWRLKDKDDHVIEGARERFGKRKSNKGRFWKYQGQCGN